MATIGISVGFHDAAVSVVGGGRILYASHAERHSRKKNDKLLNQQLADEALSYGSPDTIVYYEKPWLKKTRMMYAGQKDDFQWKKHIREFFPKGKIKTVGHHEAHACAGYFTSPFQEAVIVVADAIGEWDTLTVWEARGREIKKIWGTRYPHSLGLLYSAFTKRCGFKPNEEEYFLMALAPFGVEIFLQDIHKDLLGADAFGPNFSLKENLHLGLPDDWWPNAHARDLAASVQKVTELYLERLFDWAYDTTGMKNLVFMGGVALNCVANTKAAARSHFDDIWIMPNPGDAGSSLGAVLAYEKDFVKWEGPYLGTNIDRHLDIRGVLDALYAGEVVGVANGRAEFGPRALGNRSLLADPRYLSSKRTVNKIKQREQFRPFAAAILEEEAHKHFLLFRPTSPYMQYTARALYPRECPAVCHIDSTSRIQTVNEKQNPKFYELLKQWHIKTGCPMLLNTSLNIKRMPLVNTWLDAVEFSKTYNVKVY